MITQLLLLFSTLLAPKCQVPSSQSDTTCTAGDFLVGQTAFVTCRFPEDIADGSAIYIAFIYTRTSGESAEKDVLHCTIAKLKRSECRGEEGFVFVNATDNSVTIAIPAVTEANAGQYMCQTVPPDETTPPVCHLTVADFDDHNLLSDAAYKEAPRIENEIEKTSSSGDQDQEDCAKYREKGNVIDELRSNQTVILIIVSLISAFTIISSLVIIYMLHCKFYDDRRPLDEAHADHEQQNVVTPFLTLTIL